MNKKIICITIIGMFLLTGISSFSAIGETVENQTKTNETLQPEPEIKTTSADGVTKEIADLFVYGTGGKEYNDCNAAPIYPYYITLPHECEVDVTLIVGCHIMWDQNNWLGEWQDKWYYSFDVELPNGEKINREMQRDDIPLIPDTGSWEMSITFTADESFVGQELICDAVVEHGRKNWFIPEVFTYVAKSIYLTIDVELENDAPNKPTKPSGPTSGKPGTTYTYSTSTTDPDSDNVCYGWDWDGNDVVDEWTGFYASGEVSTLHTWTSEFTGEIKVKAKDKYDAESEWSDPLSVTMPRNRAINNPFLNILENHPILFQILQRFLNL